VFVSPRTSVTVTAPDAAVTGILPANVFTRAVASSTGATVPSPFEPIVAIVGTTVASGSPCATAVRVQARHWLVNATLRSINQGAFISLTEGIFVKCATSKIPALLSRRSFKVSAAIGRNIFPEVKPKRVLVNIIP